MHDKLWGQNEGKGGGKTFLCHFTILGRLQNVVLFGQCVFTLYLFRLGNPKATFLTWKCVSWKVLQKFVVNLVATSNSLKPWNLTHRTYHQIWRIFWQVAVLKFFGKKLPDIMVKGINCLCKGCHFLVRIPTSSKANRSMCDTESLWLPPHPPCHLLSHQTEKGPLKGKRAILLLHFKMFLCFS